MAGRLKQIVDYVKAKAFFKNMAVAQLNMIVGFNVEDFTEETPDDPELEQKLLEATSIILRSNSVDTTIFKKERL